MWAEKLAEAANRLVADRLLLAEDAEVCPRGARVMGRVPGAVGAGMETVGLGFHFEDCRSAGASAPSAAP